MHTTCVDQSQVCKLRTEQNSESFCKAESRCLKRGQNTNTDWLIKTTWAGRTSSPWPFCSEFSNYLGRVVFEKHNWMKRICLLGKYTERRFTCSFRKICFRSFRPIPWKNFWWENVYFIYQVAKQCVIWTGQDRGSGCNHYISRWYGIEVRDMKVMRSPTHLDGLRYFDNIIWF